MSQSKPSNDSLSQGTKYGFFVHPPNFTVCGTFDRYCETCSVKIENLALEKYNGRKCVECNQEVQFLFESDGVYRRCVCCLASIRCTAKFCIMCGRPNPFYDPNKPTRLERNMEQKLTEKIKREILEGTESSFLLKLENILEPKLREKFNMEMEQTDLSQACIDDGAFEDEGNIKSDKTMESSSEDPEITIKSVKQ